MFRQLAAALMPSTGSAQQAARQVLDLHPMQLSRFLEEVWATKAAPPFGGLTNMEVPGTLVPFERTSGLAALVPQPPAPTTAPLTTVVWDHLIYAYMVENTRVYEIFRRVLEGYFYGETLGVPGTSEGHRWLRTTEQLFYRDAPPFQIYSLTSWVRPDARAMRRNAYFRMFGMDLNHGTDDDRPYPYARARASNTEFVASFEELLREVWRAIENIDNQAGVDPTDDAAIANLARRLFDMLTVRRQNGNLAREELAYVATMAWFHLTLSFDSPIVLELKAEASSPEDRLLQIGERVGLPAHSRSGAYFRLADATSVILRAIEAGTFNTELTSPLLYQPPPQGARDAMQAIIRDWTIATGRDMKARKVSVSAPRPRPIAAPARPIAPPASNGRPAAVTRETLPT
jgi:hypothetical protein